MAPCFARGRAWRLQSDRGVEASDSMERAGDRHALLGAACTAPLALCSTNGRLESATPSALSLLRGLHVIEQTPASLPGDLWRALERAPDGEPVEWSPPEPARGVLGCSRYAAGESSFLLLMRELSDKRAALHAFLREQRREASGRVTASIAHEVRSQVSTILVGADFLGAASGLTRPDTLKDALRDIYDASGRLQLTVDGLLDYARIGPSVTVAVSLREALHRAYALYRSMGTAPRPALRQDLAPGCTWVRGNPFVIEQVFLNLLVGAVQAREGDVLSVRATPAPSASQLCQAGQIYVRLASGRSTASTREGWCASLCAAPLDASNVALSEARELVESQGGRLVVEETRATACIGVLLPRSEGPR